MKEINSITLEIISNGITSIAEQMGVCPREIAFVGDSDVDMKTACNAGMQPIGVLWGYREAEILKGAGAIALAADAEELYKRLI